MFYMLGNFCEPPIHLTYFSCELPMSNYV